MISEIVSYLYLNNFNVYTLLAVLKKKIVLCSHCTEDEGKDLLDFVEKGLKCKLQWFLLYQKQLKINAYMSPDSLFQKMFYVNSERSLEGSLSRVSTNFFTYVDNSVAFAKMTIFCRLYLHMRPSSNTY